MTACQCTDAQRKPNVEVQADGAVRIYCKRCDMPLLGAVGPWSTGGAMPGDFSVEIPPGSTVIRRGQWVAITHPDNAPKLVDLANQKTVKVKP